MSEHKWTASGSWIIIVCEDCGRIGGGVSDGETINGMTFEEWNKCPGRKETVRSGEGEL